MSHRHRLLRRRRQFGYPAVVALVAGLAGAALIGLTHGNHAAPVAHRLAAARASAVYPAIPPDEQEIVTIPGTASGFHARQAEIYLPPIYRTDRHSTPPVLVLMAGNPGVPSDWFHGGQVVAVMDAFAAQHHGMAPVVVVVDQLGAPHHDPLCVDGPRGNVATYLQVDVPRWVDAHLHVNPRRWAIGGASAGGTCALQTALRDPEQYPTLLDIAGQDKLLIGSEATTIREAFGGDADAYHAAIPIEQLRTHRYPQLAAMLTVSSLDKVYTSQQHHVFDAMIADHVQAVFRTVPGLHGWVSFHPSLAQAMPWLAARWGITG